MLNKFNKIIFSVLLSIGFVFNVCAEENVTNVETENQIADKVSTDALENYNPSDSLFEQITSLEQDKLLLQLEKERAQLDLEIDRINAEKLKTQMELDTISGRAEQQQQELEAAKAQIKAQTESIARQKEMLQNTSSVVSEEPVVKQQKKDNTSIDKKYKLVNISGIGNQLQATLEDLTTGQNKKISVGKTINGYLVTAISIDEGVVFEKDGEEEVLGVRK